MNGKPLDRRIFETKHAEEGRVYKQATPRSQRAGYRSPRRNHKRVGTAETRAGWLRRVAAGTAKDLFEDALPGRKYVPRVEAMLIPHHPAPLAVVVAFPICACKVRDRPDGIALAAECYDSVVERPVRRKHRRDQLGRGWHRETQDVEEKDDRIIRQP